MARLLVGLPQITGDIGKYQSRFDMVEVAVDTSAVPKTGTLKKWRTSVAPGFVFSVVLPVEVGALGPADSWGEPLDKAIFVADMLEARCILLQTPASVRPTNANRKRLAEVVERLPSEGRLICWEPSGMWELEDVVLTARSLGVQPVFDAAREELPAGSFAYTRLRSLGGTGLGAKALDTVGRRLAGRREAYVIVEDPKLASSVRQSLAARTTGAPQTDGPILVRPSAGSLRTEDEEQ